MLTEAARALIEAAPRPYTSPAEYLADELVRARITVEAALASGGEGFSLLVPGGELGPREILARADAVVAARLAATEPSPLAALTPAHTRWSAAERLALALAVGRELDPDVAAAIERLGGLSDQDGVAVSLVTRLVADDLAGQVAAARELLAATGPLRAAAVLRVLAAPTGPRLRAGRHAMAVLVGVPVPDPRVEPVSERLPPDAAVAPAVPADGLDALWRFYPDPTAGTVDSWPALLVLGAPGSGKTALTRHIAATLGMPLRSVPCDRLLDLPALEDLLARFEEVAVAGGEVLHLAHADVLGGREARARFALLRLVERRRVPLVLEAESQLTLDPTLVDELDVVLRVEEPDAERRLRILGQAVAGLALPSDRTLELHARTYPLNARGVVKAARLAAQAARARDGAGPRLDPSDLDAAAALQLRGDLGELSDRRLLGLGLGDLVLPPDTRTALLEAIDACRVHAQVMSRWGFDRRLQKGRGLCLLFYGDPGTGKTHCAEVMAAELGLRLYQVSLPRIVSKWVGETERNIERIFAAARQSQAILLFDEADSMFAQRTRVDSSTDRYANMETNYLLQQIEHYDGILILTTNFTKNLDQAVERRIAYRIEFPFPTEEERAAIWRCLIPAEAPVAADVSFEELARRFELSGGHIKNAVFRAAHRAMAAGSRLTMDTLGGAAEAECRVTGRLVRR